MKNFLTMLLFIALSTSVNIVKAAVVTFDFEAAPDVYTNNFLNPEFTQDGITVSFIGDTSINPDSVAQWVGNTSYNGSDGIMRLSQTAAGGGSVWAYANFSDDIYQVGLEAIRFNNTSFTIEAWSGSNGTGAFLGSVTVTENWSNVNTVWGSYSISSDTGIGSLHFIGSSNYSAWDNLTLTTVVPIPAPIWLFGSGLIGLIGVARRKKV